jgi:cytochrome c peroxidase
LISKNNITFLLIGFGIFLVGYSLPAILPIQEVETEIKWPPSVYDFEKNPLDSIQVELGRALFYDPILSKDNTISCASCHSNYTAFTHIDHPLSHGIYDSIGTRNSPVLVNLAWSSSFMWDGAVNNIEVQALAPITNPSEMGEDIKSVVSKLPADSEYPERFKLAYGDSIITGQRLLKALAQFQLTLISNQSDYDKMLSGELNYSDQEERGYRLFQKHCVSCHQEPLLTTGGFANNGLSVDPNLLDVGRMGVTGFAADSLKFKIPTLRNIEFSKPYMHDGRFNTLSEVLKHYSEGILHSNTLAPELQNKYYLSHENQVDIITFLITLTDKEFLFNPKFSFPRKN